MTSETVSDAEFHKFLIRLSQSIINRFQLFLELEQLLALALNDFLGGATYETFVGKFLLLASDHARRFFFLFSKSRLFGFHIDEFFLAVTSNVSGSSYSITGFTVYVSVKT